MWWPWFLWLYHQIGWWAVIVWPTGIFLAYLIFYIIGGIDKWQR